MSHIVTIQTQVRDAVALQAACARLGLPPPRHGTARLFTSEATGQIVELPGWTFPVVADLEKRQLFYDNYQGRWGTQAQLDQLLQAYAIEKARLEARKAGHGVTEQALADGSIKLTIQVHTSDWNSGSAATSGGGSYGTGATSTGGYDAGSAPGGTT